MKKIRVGLIGCGGRAGAHMNALEQMEDVEVVAVPIRSRSAATLQQAVLEPVFMRIIQPFMTAKARKPWIVFLLPLNLPLIRIRKPERLIWEFPLWWKSP